MSSRGGDEVPHPALRRARIRRWAPVPVLAAAGLVVFAVAGDSTTLNAIALFVLGVVAVYAVALVFYEIGLGEDRDRARGWRGPYDAE